MQHDCACVFQADLDLCVHNQTGDGEGEGGFDPFGKGTPGSCLF